MSQFTNQNIRLTLSDLRSKIRNGVITISYRDNGVSALKDTVASVFGVAAFHVDNFNPQTIRRFETLFDIPVGDDDGQSSDLKYPSQDATATALQNFINRRADPWAHVRAEEPQPQPQIETQLSVV